MKIIELQAENVKRLVAVTIRPDGNMVQITGKNGAGKSSVLDSLWWALDGASHIQAAPIRKGADKARIRLDLGELVVTRTFREGKAGGYTTSISVENAEGARFPSPQRMIDDLLGALTFDPLEFARARPEDQFDTLKTLVPGIDFDDIEGKNRGDYAKRTDENRSAKELRNAAGLIQVPPDTPDEPVDESDLVDELQNAGEHNATIEQRKARREEAQRDAVDKRADAERHEGRAAELRAQADDFDQQSAAALEAAAAIDKKIEDAEELPEPVDTGALRERIAAARTTNKNVTAKKARALHLADAEEHEAEAKRLSETINQRDKQKVDAIRSAKLPVEGIGFGTREILLNEIPFAQASDAEQLRVSLAIAMAMSPKLKVIRVRDGSLLDDDAMKLISEMADEHDFQVWIEVVRNDGKVGFVIEDGNLANPPVEAQAAE